MGYVWANIPQGFWQRALSAAPSTVDWCEPNYVHTALVAESWNSVSSLPLLALGLYGAWNARRQRLATRFVLAFLCLALIGLGSTAFHATLLRPAQATDELPMIYVSLVFLYCLRFSGHAVEADIETSAAQQRWRWGLAAFGACFSAAYIALSQSFLPFVVTFAVTTVVIIGCGARFAYAEKSPPVYRRFFWCSSAAMAGSFLLFWVPEHVLLGCRHPLQALQLHAWFHLLSGSSGYALALWLSYDSLLVGQRKPSLEQRLFIPRLRASTPPELGTRLLTTATPALPVLRADRT
jgi:dihydroceramidase